MGNLKYWGKNILECGLNVMEGYVVIGVCYRQGKSEALGENYTAWLVSG